MTKVQCRCGALEIEITAEPIIQVLSPLRRLPGRAWGAYAPGSVYPAEAVQIVRGNPIAWRLKRNPRATCRECSARLFIDVKARRLRGVNGFLLLPAKFEPAFRVHASSQSG